MVVDIQDAAEAYINSPTEANRRVLAEIGFNHAKRFGERMRLARGLPTEAADGIESDAMLGLLQAINRWDPLISPHFRVFLRQRVTSCVLDGFRKVDHLSRDHRRSLRKAGLDTSPAFSKPLSVFAPANGEDELTLMDRLSDTVEDIVGSDLAELDELRSLIAPAMMDLKKFRPNHFRAVCLFVTDEKVGVLAEELGVTESRISQYKWEGIEMLRAAVSGTKIRPTRKINNKARCKGPGCNRMRPPPTGRRGRPAVYCSDECKRNAAKAAREKKKEEQ